MRATASDSMDSTDSTAIRQPPRDDLLSRMEGEEIGVMDAMGAVGSDGGTAGRARRVTLRPRRADW
ncbi:hypothetical protein GCM10017557_54390 [Streptomyces aurantiacus]|uniref:Uncharacterized protein n=1 Tax=Streptomyces aurantiacus TaxID=47760 RepID=A0A7G1P9W2_9ACTN|nr:hypothetical protein GCM10017557_54390 [Streptomyces aurantiacus]